MPTCFVIQPFDSGKFDQRFEETFAPAIRAADLEPYRVDQDAKVAVPISSIEDGIRAAAVCLADITLDNPNVWYELGFAFAAGRPVVMICSKERKGKYPFDIQHRFVISYKTEAPSDFKTLGDAITERLLAAVERGQRLQQTAQAEPIAAVGELSTIEVALIWVAAGIENSPDAAFDLGALRSGAQRDGLLPIHVNLALKRLIQKNFFESAWLENHVGDSYKGMMITSSGWNWIDMNEDRFHPRRARKV